LIDTSAELWPAKAAAQYERVRPAPVDNNPQKLDGGPSEFAQRALERQREMERRAFIEWKPRPWYVAYPRASCLYVWIVVAGWVIGTLNRALGAHRPFVAQDRSPRCRQCGYILIGLESHKDCPECGLPVLKSVGDEVDPGTYWDRARGVRLAPAFLATLVSFLLRPRHAAGRLAAFPSNRRATFFHVGIILLAMSGCAIVLALDADWGRARTLVQSTWGGIIAAGSIGVMTSTAAILVGWSYQRVNRRSVLSGAGRVASYCSVHLWLTALCIAIVVREDSLLSDVIGVITTKTGWAIEFTGILLACACGLLALIGFTLLVRIASKGIQHAFR
jgi:hypothetical protein